MLARFDPRGAVLLLHGHHDQGPHLPAVCHPANVSCHQVSAVGGDAVVCWDSQPLASLPTKHPNSCLHRNGGSQKWDESSGLLPLKCFC